MVPTLFMLAFLVYFLMPLGWLFVASTKSLDDLFSSFGLWFADFNLVDNIKDTFTKDDGVYVDWLRNTLMYSFVSAGGAALLAAAAGYGFAVRLPGQEPAVLVRPRLGDGADDGARDPDVPDVRRARVHEQPAVRHPAVAGQSFGIYLMRIYAEASVPSDLMEAARIDGAGEFRIFRQIAFRLLAGLRDRPAVHLRRDLEQLLPPARDALRAEVVPAHRGARAVERAGRPAVARQRRSMR